MAEGLSQSRRWTIWAPDRGPLAVKGPKLEPGEEIRVVENGSLDRALSALEGMTGHRRVTQREAWVDAEAVLRAHGRLGGDGG